MRGETFTLAAKAGFVTEDCINCGVIFALPENLQRRRLEDHKDFYCPNGHPMIYTGPSEAEKLREQLAKEQARAVSLLAQTDQAVAALAEKNRELKAAKAELTRTVRRVDHGVCPHCNRSFVNVARHMVSKHAALGAPR